MTKFNFYLVTYDRLLNKVTSQLTNDELESVKCYCIQKKISKNIQPNVEVLNEWELEWNDFTYQQKQYYEYGTIVHLTKNPQLIDGLSHIGLLHYDTVFNSGSINSLYSKISENPNQIFYQRIRYNNELYLTKYEVDMISEFMSDKLRMSINSDFVWNNGWISEALSLTPKEVFLKFGNYLIDNRTEIEDILIKNRWGIMNHINHRICGIIERMWGMYLVSLNLPLVKMNIEHDWNSYIHKHQSESNWIK